ncbi:hypothetical protein [Streptomyces sp. A 4/2]|uniref:hypothetical protein n=1 Tax=Streptomyces sp. A 4/2 TaxID=2934314 RepID=UPI0020242829|nr:hypothetical protein [Streptomyces sp. A 4/2]
MKMISTGRRRAEPAAAPRSQLGADSAAIGGDELRARAYVKAALGETDTLTPTRRNHHTAAEGEGESPAVAPGAEVHHHHYYYAETQAPTAGRDRTFDFSWIVADKARLSAVAAGALIQPALYTLAHDAGTAAPVGMAFMAALITGSWRLRYPGAITRWLFTLNVSAAVLYGPTFLLIVTALTGAS